MKPIAQSTVKTASHSATEQLRQGKSTREVACNLRISVSSVIKVRKEDKENIPEPHLGRPRKISTKTRGNLARHFI
jgi:transposase